MQMLDRLLVAVIMTAMMVFVVTLIVTYLNLGFRGDFVMQWARAYFISWPIAAIMAFLVMPMARRATNRLMGARST
jgi:nucleoside permease NupC